MTDQPSPRPPSPRWQSLRWPSPRTAAVEVALLGAAALDSLMEITTSGRVWPWAAVALALAGMLLRHRHPVAGFVATLPGLVTSFALIATLVTLYTLALRSPRRRPVIVAVAVTVVGSVVKVPVNLTDLAGRETLLSVVYALLSGAAPAALGQLIRAQDTLRRQLHDLDAAHRAERTLRDQQVLERERNRLAREMHDVVSHQVSLIAVQAGALQVAAPDPASGDAARTIRQLAVATLGELRHMVAVLRATEPGGPSLQPQPGLAQLRSLVEGAEVDATLDLAPDTHRDLDRDLDPHAQRAVYRTVQEGLTNVRKHAPGSTVRVSVVREGAAVEVTVHNTRPTAPPLELPGSRQGLVGLRERADLAGGTLTAGPDDHGGYRLLLRLPANRAPDTGRGGPRRMAGAGTPDGRGGSGPSAALGGRPTGGTPARRPEGSSS